MKPILFYMFYAKHLTLKFIWHKTFFVIHMLRKIHYSNTKSDGLTDFVMIGLFRNIYRHYKKIYWRN